MTIERSSQHHVWGEGIDRTYDMIEVRPGMIGQGISCTVQHHFFTHPDVKFGSYNHITGGTILHLAFPMSMTMQVRDFVDDQPSYVEIRFWRIDTLALKIHLSPGDCLLDEIGRVIVRC